MSVSLGKDQLHYVAADIRKELESIGDDEINRARQEARERFFKTKEGKMIEHLRAKYGSEKYCSKIGSEIVTKVEEDACKAIKKPFQYVNKEDIARRAARLAMDAKNGQDLIDMVKREWYAKLTPAVRKRFNLKLS